MTFEKKSKIKTVIFAFLLFISLILVFSIYSNQLFIAYADYGPGSGTESDPIQISTLEHLNQLNDDLVNPEHPRDFGGVYFKLMNDINIEGGGLKTIGLSGGKEFQGNFDGNNHIIYNINSENNPEFRGLFYKIGNLGKVSKLGLYNVNLHNQGEIGGISIINSGTIEQCFVSGNFSVKSTSGGLVAVNDGGNVVQSFSSGNMEVNVATAGGLIGFYKSGTIENNYSILKFNGAYDANTTGALIGQSEITDHAKINNNSFGYRKKIQYNNTEIPGHNADLQSIGNLSLGPAKEKNILLEKYQTESIYFLFGTQEQMWQRERNVLQGDGIFAPYLKSFITSDQGEEGKKHNHMVLYSATVKYFGYIETYYNDWGTPYNPFLINNTEQFHMFSYNVSKGISFENKYIKLNSTNLEFKDDPSKALSGVGIFQPGAQRPFKGTFDGDNNEIPSFYVKRPIAQENLGYETTALGFFNNVENATIKNLRFSHNTTVDGIGLNTVGGLVGYAKNSKFENIFIQTKVKNIIRNTNAGGIIGENSGPESEIQTVMFYGKLNTEAEGTLDSISIGGIIGKDYGPLDDEKCFNAWHFVSHDQLFLDNYLNLIGNIFLDTNWEGEGTEPKSKPTLEIITTANGERATFKITTAPDSLLNIEYRYLNEEVAESAKIEPNNFYTIPSKTSLFTSNSNEEQRLFARYVKEIMIRTKADDATIEERKINFYVGQSVNFSIDLKSGFYLSDITGWIENSATSDYLDLTYENLVVDNFYSKIRFKDVLFGERYGSLKESYSEIRFEFKSITFQSGFFGENSGAHTHVYCGEPIEADTNLSENYKFNKDQDNNDFGKPLYALVHYEKINKEGIKVNYEGIAPKDANTATISSYYLDFIIYMLSSEDNTTKIYLGKKQIEYKITQKEIIINEEAINTTKEYNGITGTFEKTTVDNTKVPDIYDVDKNKVIINATIKYNGEIPGLTQATVRLSIHDIGYTSSSRNYKIKQGEEEKEVSSKILKRKIYLPISDIVDLEKEYDGNGPDIKVSIVNANVDGKSLINRGDIQFNYTRITGESINISMPGTFKVEVSFVDESKESYFDIIFTEQTGDTEEFSGDVVTTIEKRKVEIEYFNADNLIYDENVKEVKLKLIPKYVDRNGAEIKLGNEKEVLYTIKLNDEIVDAIKDAGTYLIEAIDFEDENYTLDENNNTCKYLVLSTSLNREIVVSKANQGAVNIISSNQYSYNINESYIFEAEGGFIGNFIYSINEEDERNTAEGEILEDGTLYITKFGIFVVTAKREGDDNYFPVTSEPFLLEVSKSSAILKIEDLEIKYGQIIEPKFSVEGFTELPIGFVAPSIRISKANENVFSPLDINNKYDIGQYRLRIIADSATSNVVEFQNEVVFSNLAIVKRDVTINILENIETTYGEDIEISYTAFTKIGDEDLNVEDLDIEIVGTLSRQEGINVGEYDIEIGNLLESNPNLNVTLDTKGHKYIINPANLTFSFVRAEKNYGAEDPVPEFTVTGFKYQDKVSDFEFTYELERASGESVRIEGYTYYLANDLSINCENYVVNFVTTSDSKLFIKKAYVIIKDLEPIEKPVLTNLSNDEIDNITAKFYVKTYDASTSSWEEVTVSGEVKWTESALSQELDFKNSETLSRTMEFRIDSSEYRALSSYEAVTEFDVTIKPQKREAIAEFTNVPNLVYRGRTYGIGEVTSLLIKGKEYDEEISDDNFEIIVSGELKNAGTYNISIKLKGHNYYFKSGNQEKIMESTQITIGKVNLEVKLLDMTYKDNEVPEKGNIEYIGFINGENETNLEKVPTCILPTKPGVYSSTVKPSGGESTNYKFNYIAGNIIVNRHEMSSDSEDEDSIKAVFYGNYNPEITISLKETTDQKRLSQTNSQIKALSKTNKDFSNKKAKMVLQVKGEKDKEVQQMIGADKIIFEATEEYADLENVMLMIVDINNNVSYVNATVENGQIIVEGENIEYVVFVEDKPPYLMYAGIALAGMAIIIILSIIIKMAVKKKKEKQYVKFRQVYEK